MGRAGKRPGQCPELLPVFQPGEKVLAAVSGGADSVCLLLLLVQLREKKCIDVCAAHVNHMIRGRQADEDQAFVEELCKKLSVPLFVERIDVPAIAKERGHGLETEARQVRQEFLLRVCRDCQADVIATGHHAKDQAETVLMHLLRGGGLRGAGGIRARDGLFCRPLLRTGKEEILQYLKKIGQSFREDATNFVPDNPRNALRLQVLPEMEKVYPGSVTALGRFSVLAAEADEYITNQARKFLRENAVSKAYGIRLSLPWRSWCSRPHADTVPADTIPADIEPADTELADTVSTDTIPTDTVLADTEPAGTEHTVWSESVPPHPAVLRRALDLLTENQDFDRTDTLLSLCTGEAEKGAVEWGSNRYERIGAYLYCMDLTRQKPEAIPLKDGACLRHIGTIHMVPWQGGPVRDNSLVQVVDAGCLKGAVLRTRLDGDRMRPLGAPGTRKLSDIMMEKGVDRPERNFWPLLAGSERILWAVGLCLGQEASVSDATGEKMRLEWIPFKEEALF